MKIIKASCFFLFYLSFFWSKTSSAVDYIPVTPSGISILNLCLSPERAFSNKPATLSGQAHCKIENIVLKAYREAWFAHQAYHSTRKFLNAGISGKETGKGMTLLTFATLNGFRRLALWGLTNGADINRKDLDGNTPLKQAIHYSLTYMVDFALQQGADVNKIIYIDNEPTTALKMMIDARWSVPVIRKLLVETHAQTHNSEYSKRVNRILFARQQQNMHYSKLSTAIDPRRWSHILTKSDYMDSSFLIPASMTQAMDRYIRFYMENGHITNTDMNTFEVHGRRFEHFLAINGFSESLEYRLTHSLSKKEAKKRLYIRGLKGDDVLLAAIKSQSYKTVQTVLQVSNFNVNHKIPDRPGYENIGKKPLDIAQQLNASPELVELLIHHDAAPYKPMIRGAYGRR